jgi:large subunit ribosomal protein L9
VKVLLIKDVKSLGKIGAIKEVKDGYGQNFLIGKGFAKKATPEVIQEWESNKAQAEADEKALIERLTKESKQLAELTTTLEKKAGQGDSLFGAVTKDEIAHAIKDQHGLDIDKKHIEHKLSIKHTGEFDIDIKMGHAIHATTKLVVEAL